MIINWLIPRKNDDNWRMFLEPSFRRHGFTKVLQIMDQPGLTENIFKKYNAGIEALFSPQCGVLNDDDICIFCHEDIGIADPFFRQKIEMIFTEKRDIGILGVCGTTEFTEHGGWWMNTPNKLRGHIIQGKDNAPIGEGYHLVKGPIGFFDDLVCVDGCFMATTGRFIKEGIRFDMQTFNEGNDFYDIDFCFQFLERGYKIAVADILLFHKSSGMGSMTESWKVNKDKLIKKWTDKGYKFPIVRNDFKIKENQNNIVEIEI
ncbi:MAG: glycosyltransferase [Candidatus Woesearchaeota archaeon]